MRCVSKIVSGGQTGVDMAAWDAAMELGVAFGGYVPAGGTNERGLIDAKYFPIEETETANVFERTKKNVEMSDATLIIYRGE